MAAWFLGCWLSLSAAEDPPPVTPHPLARYEALWTKSLFRPKNQTNSAAPSRFVLVGIMELEGHMQAGLREAATGNLCQATPEADGQTQPKLIQTLPGGSPGETMVEIEFHGQRFKAGYAKTGETSEESPSPSVQIPLAVPIDNITAPVSSVPVPRTRVEPQRSSSLIAPVPSHGAPNQTKQQPVPQITPATPSQPVPVEEPLLIEPPPGVR
ncbi:MAG: hypothetical protein IT576_06085 [Verrucomicrobiales bacterium]|nr:hypothetical protein [Verrucomicrobiales bacterium]